MARFTNRGIVRAAIALGGAALLAAACQAPKTEEQATEQKPEQDLVTASALVGLPVGTAPADLPDSSSEAAQTYAKFCSACHGIPNPSSHSATDWPVVLRRMWLRTEGLPAGYTVPVPDQRERLLIQDYVLAHALKVTNAELPAVPGRALFESTCSRCHELPDPRQHAPQDWAAVVIRMRQHMVQILHQSPPQSQVQEIILFLEQASKAGA
jgi:cytochrome c5